MSGKATKAETAARVEAVFELRLGGAGFADIRQYASEPTDRQGQKLPPWEVSDRQLWRYIAAADRLCKERYDARAGHLLARHLIRRERLYAHCLEIGDYKGALAVLKDQADLEGHYQRVDLEQPADEGERPPLDAAGVVKLLTERLWQTERAELPAADKARLVAVLSDSLLRALGIADMEVRLAALEQAAERQKGKTMDQHRGNTA